MLTIEGQEEKVDKGSGRRAVAGGLAAAGGQRRGRKTEFV